MWVSECVRVQAARRRATPDTGIVGKREDRAMASDLRSVAKTVVVRYSLDATGTGHGHVTALVSEINPDHGHRSHGCWCLGRIDTRED